MNLHPISTLFIRTFKFSNLSFIQASFLNYYGKVLTLAGLEKITVINQGQLSHYVTVRRKPGKKTVEKIEQNLHQFTDELKEVGFR